MTEKTTSISVTQGEAVLFHDDKDYNEGEMISVLHHAPGRMPIVMYRAKVINGQWVEGGKEMQNG